MSKEFEEIVLEKLNALDNKATNTDKVIKDVILEKLDILETKFINLETEVSGLKTEVGSLKTEIKDTNKRLGNLEMEVKDTGEVVNYLNQNFTKFDYEINKKIDTLFDAIAANNEKHDVFEKSIVSLNTKTFNHDIRISVLEDYSKNAKLFAMN